jgi:predicted AAA+ superfamily ATPase
MNEQIIEYIRTQLSRNRLRLRPYVFPKPESEWRYPARYAYIRIKKYLSDILEQSSTVPKRWIIIPGMSGTGKTTILAQLYFEFFNEVKPNRIIYISLEDVALLGSSLKEVLDVYENILGESFESIKNPVILFIDEVHRDPEWANTITSIYNRSTKVIVICSGSSAVSLQTNASDIGRRAIFEKLYPLSFGEFLMIKKNKFPDKKLKQNLKEAFYESKSASEVFKKLKVLEKQINLYWANVEETDIDEFLTIGTLPYAIGSKDRAEVFRGLDVQLDKIIQKDIRDLSTLDNTTIDSIKRLLFLLAENDQTAVTNLSSVLGITRPTVESILDVLMKAELIIRLQAHGSAEKKTRQPSKFLFMSPAVRMTLLDITGIESTFLTQKGKLLEDIAGLHFYREFISTGRGSLSYDSSKGGADFILKIENKKQIIMEIGNGHKDTKQVETTMQKNHSDYGIVICNRKEITLIEEKNLIMVPKEFFLCM